MLIASTTNTRLMRTNLGLYEALIVVSSRHLTILRAYRLEYIEDRLSKRSFAAFTELSMMSDIPKALKWIISESNEAFQCFLHVRESS